MKIPLFQKIVVYHELIVLKDHLLSLLLYNVQILKINKVGIEKKNSTKQKKTQTKHTKLTAGSES